MESGEYLYIIGVGSPAHLETGRGRVFYTEHENGERLLPVWTNPDACKNFGLRNVRHFGSGNPEYLSNPPYMQMLDDTRVLEGLLAHTRSHGETPTGVRFTVIEVNSEWLAKIAAKIEANRIVRDPGPFELGYGII